ncbi:MAG TPA: SRPBCC domain-containing protein [Puia sp.]|nr:SRPBCC domain-containing protein [Puia sp.]
MTKTIKHQIFFPHPVETVWEYLTKPELMEQWLMKNDFQPIIGLDFQFRTNPIPSLDFDGIFYCKVLEIVPFKKLSYSWKSGPGEGEITLDSVVVWKLQPTDKGTELFLEHSGFTKIENLNFYNGLIDGWLKNIQKIADRLNAAQHGNTNA